MQTYQDILFQVQTETEQIFFRVPDSYKSEFSNGDSEDPFLEFLPWPIKVSSIIFGDGSQQFTAGGGGGGQNQTPWLSDIDADGFSLENVASVGLANGNPLLTFTNTVLNINTSYLYVGVPGVTRMITLESGEGRLGIANPTPTFRLDVTGDINIDDPGGANGYAFRVNGVPIGGGGPAPPNQAVQFNDNGIPGGSANFIWDNAASQLIIGTGAQSFQGVIIRAQGSRGLLAGFAGAYPNYGELDIDAKLLLLCRQDLSNGTVGIGVLSPNPQFKLDVAGDVNITGVYRINGAPIISGSTDPSLATIITANGSMTLQPAPGWFLICQGRFVVNDYAQFHGALYVDSGAVVLSNVPTSPDGLQSGQVWNNGGVLNIV